jgi:hypothetical protein
MLLPGPSRRYPTVLQEESPEPIAVSERQIRYATCPSDRSWLSSAGAERFGWAVSN